MAVLPFIVPGSCARPQASAYAVPPALHDGDHLSGFRLFVEGYPFAGPQTPAETLQRPGSEPVVSMFAQHHGVVSRAVVAPVGRMVRGPLVHPHEAVPRRRPDGVRHVGFAGLDDPQALRPGSETIVGVDIVDEEFLAERTDGRVGLERQQRARCDHRFHFHPCVGARPAGKRRVAADLDVRCLHSAVGIPEAGSNDRQMILVGKGGVDRLQLAHHVGVDAGVLIEQQCPRGAERRPLHADIEGARDAQILRVQDQDNRWMGGNLAQHLELGFVRAVVDDHERADLCNDASRSLGKLAVRMIGHHNRTDIGGLRRRCGLAVFHAARQPSSCVVATRL